jgi:hypothetical protein
MRNAECRMQDARTNLGNRLSDLPSAFCILHSAFCISMTLTHRLASHADLDAFLRRLMDAAIAEPSENPFLDSRQVRVRAHDHGARHASSSTTGTYFVVEIRRRDRGLWRPGADARRSTGGDQTAGTERGPLLDPATDAAACAPCTLNPRPHAKGCRPADPLVMRRTPRGVRDSRAWSSWRRWRGSPLVSRAVANGPLGADHGRPRRSSGSDGPDDEGRFSRIRHCARNHPLTGAGPVAKYRECAVRIGLTSEYRFCFACSTSRVDPCDRFWPVARWGRKQRSPEPVPTARGFHKRPPTSTSCRA